MDKSKWVWMPHAGHHICSRDCIFHLNTYVGKHIVSTIGEYWPDRNIREIHAQINNFKWLMENKKLLGDDFDNSYLQKFGYMEIDMANHYFYETIVFIAKKSKHKCCPYEIKKCDISQVDCDGYNTPDEAYKGHLRLCKKWSETEVKKC